jgi:feruloyl esterase
MGHLSHYGFASMSTDTGHLSHPLDGKWALNAPESIVDWGWRAMHGTVDLGKSIVEQYYGSNIRYSYYAGCSTGGRQGLKEMQISPSSFDGILAGAPAWWTSHLQSWTTWYPLQNYPTDSPGYIPAEKFVDIAMNINQQCDGQDGDVDGINQSPLSCIIDYTALDLTEPQVETLRTLYSNWTAPDGSFLFPSHTPGSFLLLADPTNANPLGYTFYSYFVKNDTSYNFTDFTLADLEQGDRTNPGSANADAFDAITAFRKRGGKLLMYHGWLDPAIPAGSSLYYYNRTMQALTDEVDGQPGDVDDYFRLFMVANMGHCSGSQPPGPDSNAPWYFSAASQNPGPAVSKIKNGVPDKEGLWEYDAILALMRWVEDGKGPDHLVVTKFKDDVAPEVERRGLVCPWPRRAVRSDADGVEGWKCVL